MRHGEPKHQYRGATLGGDETTTNTARVGSSVEPQGRDTEQGTSQAKNVIF